MEFINEIESLNNIIKNLEVEQEELMGKYCQVAELIEKLLLVIERDNFNSAQGYNYCRNLKELLIKKRNYSQLNSRYKGVLKAYKRQIIELKVNKKKAVLESRNYMARVINDDEDILSIIKQEE